MLFIGWLRWWYGVGWLKLLRTLMDRVKGVYLGFSVPMLLRTLGKPWRQIIASKDPNAMVGQKLRALIDNLISRVIGFWVRLLTVLTAMLVSALIVVLGLAGLILWPLLPVAVILLSVRGTGLL